MNEGETEERRGKLKSNMNEAVSVHHSQLIPTFSKFISEIPVKGASLVKFYFIQLFSFVYDYDKWRRKYVASADLFGWFQTFL